MLTGKFLLFLTLMVQLFESGNRVICADGAGTSAFSSVKFLSISQLCVKVLLNKNAQNIDQVHNHLGENVDIQTISCPEICEAFNKCQ